MELGKQWSCTSDYAINAIRTDFERILQEAGHRQTDLQAVRLPAHCAYRRVLSRIESGAPSARLSYPESIILSRIGDLIPRR